MMRPCRRWAFTKAGACFFWDWAPVWDPMIVDGILEPMEVAHLPYKKGRTFEDYLGLRGLKRMGKKKWRRYVAEVVEELKNALEADYVVLGGGNAKLLKKLPPGARLGDNSTAFTGGFRLWQGSNDGVTGRRTRKQL